MHAPSEKTPESFDVWYEPETRFICIRYAPGKIQESHARRLTETVKRYLREHCAEADAVYFLVDIRHASGMSAEARKAFAESAGRQNNEMFRGHFFVGIFGGSLAFRVFLNMLMKALRGVSNRVIGTLEADEASARAWLNERKMEALVARPDER